MQQELNHEQFGNNSLQISQIHSFVPHFQLESHENSYQLSLTDQHDNFDYQYKREQIEKEYKLKLESVIKKYQLKLDKERQTFSLKEKNYEQEITTLKNQIKQAELQKISSKKQYKKQGVCSYCSNGEVIQHMKNIIDALEETHQECIGVKHNLHNEISSLEQKILILEERLIVSEENQHQMKNEIRQIKQEKDIVALEKKQLERIQREKQRIHHSKQMQFQYQINKARNFQKQYQARYGKQNHFQDRSNLWEVPNKQNFENLLPPNILVKTDKTDKNEIENTKVRQNTQQKNYSSYDLLNDPSKSFIHLQDVPTNTIDAKNYQKTMVMQSYADYAKMKRMAKMNYEKKKPKEFQTFRPNELFNHNFQ